MKLVDALRLNSTPCIAFVGAGGKTTAIFQLARQIPPPVLVTATTHLANWQVRLADHHFLFKSPNEVDILEHDIPTGINVLTGLQTGHDRLTGLDLATLDRVWKLAESNQIPLLIEADGSRQRSLKAPASYEPVIPPCVDTVVVVAGLSAIGKPLTSEWVHRPELFSLLSGLQIGAEITLKALARVLTHPSGGLKNIPGGTRRIALLNQVDTFELQSQAQSLGKMLFPAYQVVVVSSLVGVHGAKIDVHYLQQPFDEHLVQDKQQVIAVIEPVAGIILAAGGSYRFGRPKQLVDWGGKPLVEHVVSIALRAGLSPIVVVTGANGKEIQAVLQHLPVTIVPNTEWKSGQSTSVKAGVMALPPETGGVVFLLVDQPFIHHTLVSALVEKHTQTLSPIVAPQIDGQRGNPILFDRVAFPDLLTLIGDTGGRVLFSRYSPSWILWHDAKSQFDIDTPEDYHSLFDLID